MEYIIIYTMIFLFGITIGSFLNVCIYRIPKKEDIVSERSHCMSCGNVLKWYELIPLFSFLAQGGKCRNCKVKLSLQYPMIELLNGLIYIWIFMVKGFAVESILFCICASVLIVISVIDWRTYEIPFGCNVIIGILGIVRLILDLAHWYDYVIGFFAVSGLFMIAYWITRGRGIGGGDIKLMAAAGLLLGWKNILFALMVGSIAGSVIHLTLMKLKNKDRVLAFGPYLALGIFVAMLYGDKIINWYLKLCGL
ncbi:MAG: prepilin peptidase [Lachnospiraceae bacterium]|nr:prepilin peptidase [Lachnospiraceae bacterium]